MYKGATSKTDGTAGNGNTISAKVAAGDGAAGDGNTIVDIETSKTEGNTIIIPAVDIPMGN